MNKLPKMSLGSQIRYYRGQLGWTLERLSEACEVDVGTISALETRESKRSQYATKIAAGFGLTLNQLEDESTDYTEFVKQQTAPAANQERALYLVGGRDFAPPLTSDEKTLLDGFRAASEDSKRHLLMIAKDALDRFEKRSEPKN